MRALKEELFIAPSTDVVPAHIYQQCLEKSLNLLTEIERRSIYFRFWESFSIAVVADLIGISWDAADVLIDGAVEKLRNEMIRKKNELEIKLTEVSE